MRHFTFALMVGRLGSRVVAGHAAWRGLKEAATVGANAGREQRDASGRGAGAQASPAHGGRPHGRRGYRVSRLSRGRRVVLDVLRLAARQPTIHGLLEVDVTGVRRRLESADGSPTMTAFIVASLGRAIRDYPEINVRRAGRKVVWFDAIDVVVTVERIVEDAILPVPVPVCAADAKSVGAITSELRVARAAPLGRAEDRSGRSVLAVLPPSIRRVGAVALGRFPRAAARFGPAIGVSSVGMFGAGWGIPLSPLTLMVTIGGPTTRAVLVDGRPESREYLPVTLSFDHSVIDGAPAARFATRLRHLLETAAVLDQETEA